MSVVDSPTKLDRQKQVIKVQSPATIWLEQ